MAKFYVKNGKNVKVLQADCPKNAAIFAISRWRKEKKRVGKSIRVSQVGFEFDSGHPDHELDVCYCTPFIKR